MKSYLLTGLAGALVVLVMSTHVDAQATLYSTDLDSEVVGPFLPTGWFEFHGDGASDAGGTEQLIWEPEVTASGGTGGTPGFTLNFNSSGNVGSYFYGGVGNFFYGANEANPIAGGGAGTDNPSRFRFSMDMKVTGNFVFPDTNQNVTPLELTVAGYDDNYDTVYGIDGNDDDIVNGADRYLASVFPTLINMGDYVNVSFTLDQGTIDADTNVPVPIWGNDLGLAFRFTFNSGGFDNDAGNSISVDNVLVEFLGPATGLDGDYNGNDVIDAADYTVWRDALTAGSTTLTNDPTPGVVDESDFTYWRTHFGETMGAGAGSGSAVVPEPTSLSLISVLAMCLLGARSWRRRAGV